MMKVVIVVAMLGLTTCFAGAAHAQIGQPKGRVPDGLSLIDDAHVSGFGRAGAQSRRFTVILIRSEALLLDTETGDTWYLAFADSGRPLSWQTVPRGDSTNRDASSFSKQGAKLDEAMPSNGQSANPFSEHESNGMKGSPGKERKR